MYDTPAPITTDPAAGFDAGLVDVINLLEETLLAYEVSAVTLAGVIIVLGLPRNVEAIRV